MLGELDIILLTIVAAAIAAVSQYFMKSSVHRFQLSPSGILSLLRNKGVMAAIGLYITGSVFYLLALDSGQLSFIYSIFASTFVFVLLISYFALREKVSKARLIGTALIILGVIIIAITY